MSAVKKFKEEAPKWTTYFTKLQIKIIYRILFYANNSANLAFASYETYQKDCDCSHMTIRRTIIKAEKLGILENQTKTKVSIDYKNSLIYFKKRLSLKWLGDVVLKQSEAFISLNVSENVNQNVSLYNKKRNSLKREESKSPFSFSLENKIQEELKEYPENLRDSFKNHLESKYENKRHFIPIDFKEQLERFKRVNPLKKCYTCNQTHFESGSTCLKCTLESQEKALQVAYKDLGVKEQEHSYKIEEPSNPKLKKVWEQLKNKIQGDI